MTGRGRRGDEAAAPVLEAILVALLVLSAILFVSSVQRPLLGSEAGGVDLGGLAAETLGLLQHYNLTVGGKNLRFEEMVNATLQGDNATALLVDRYVTRVLPPGTRHALFLTNGEGTLRLLPTAYPGQPRNARAAEVPFLPHWGWSRHNASAAVNASWAAPGQALGAADHPVLYTFTDSASTVQCLRAPDGSAYGPGHVRWLKLWQDGSHTVPAGAPHGVWSGYTNAGCSTGATYGRVGLKAGTLSDFPLYGLRLVVWFGT